MPKNKPLNFTDPAPDVKVYKTNGELIALSSLWQDRPLLLAFTRHFGCTQCKEMLDELSAQREKINQAGLEIAVVTQGSSQETGEFCAQYAPDLVCLADPERKAYRAYRLERGTLFQTVLNVKVLRAVSRSKKEKGYAVELPPAGQDAMQMAGAFIIGTNGRIELPYYYDDIADHPSVDLLLKGALSTKWNQPFDGPLGPDHE